MIHICFGIHDANGIYSKYTASAICSVFENTSAKITVHLIHDDTLNEECLNRFKLLAKKYNQEICFYCIKNNDELTLRNLIKNKPTTIGTLFRLYMSELLPKTVEKTIYLDSDLIVKMDIEDLWNTDLKECYLAAVCDAEGERWLCKSGMVERTKYFNAGVILFDLNKIRNLDIKFHQYIDFLNQYPKCLFADQDALNYFYKDKVKYLDPRYNNFVYFLRKADEKKTASEIYHFAGDYIDPTRMDVFDELFFKYLAKTPWSDFCINNKSFQTALLNDKKKIMRLQKILLKLTRNSCKKIIFGATSELNVALKNIIGFNPDIDYYIDNNKNIHGSVIDDMKVFSPSKVKEEDFDKIIIIVLSNNYYNEIKNQLIEYGLAENENFFNGKDLLLLEQGGFPSYV